LVAESLHYYSLSQSRLLLPHPVHNAAVQFNKLQQTTTTTTTTTTTITVVIVEK